MNTPLSRMPTGSPPCRGATGGQVALALLLLGLAGLSLASCAKPPPPKIAVHALKPPPPPPPPPAPPPPSVAPPTVDASWNFQPNGACTATAAAPSLSLDIAATGSQLVLTGRSTGKIALHGHRPVPIALMGTAGDWTITGRVADRHRVTAAQRLTEQSAGQVLVLLEGGTVHFGGPASELPKLRVPNGGPDGKAWFDCVRRLLGP